MPGKWRGFCFLKASHGRLTKKVIKEGEEGASSAEAGNSKQREPPCKGPEVGIYMPDSFQQMSDMT